MHGKACVAWGPSLFARPPHALAVIKDGAHAAAATPAPSHLLRSRGGPRESQDPDHEFGLARDASVVVAQFFSISVSRRGVGGCSATRARRRRHRACSDALHVRGGSRFSCSTAMRPFCSSNLPVWSRFRSISHTVVRPPLVRISGKRQMVQKRDQTGGSDE
jgi:hypothetical protein